MYPQTATLLNSNQARRNQNSGANYNQNNNFNNNLNKSNAQQGGLQKTGSNLNNSGVNYFNNSNIAINLSMNSPAKNNNVQKSNSKNLAFGMLLKQKQGEGEKLETKSSKEYIGRDIIIGDEDHLGNSEVRMNYEASNNYNNNNNNSKVMNKNNAMIYTGYNSKSTAPKPDNYGRQQEAKHNLDRQLNREEQNRNTYQRSPEDDF